MRGVSPEMRTTTAKTTATTYVTQARTAI